jgi:hypothetical protein
LVHAYDLYEQMRIDYKFGIQGGRRERDREIARKLKSRRHSFEEIAEDTDLSLEEIGRLY